MFVFLLQLLPLLLLPVLSTATTPSTAVTPHFRSLCVVVLRLCPCELFKFHFNHNFRDKRDVSARAFPLMFIFLSHLCSLHHRAVAACTQHRHYSFFCRQTTLPSPSVLLCTSSLSLRTTQKKCDCKHPLVIKYTEVVPCQCLRLTGRRTRFMARICVIWQSCFLIKRPSIMM
ncbi:uncharacterized protein LOC127741164 [Arachis duranensis]|uniref:Uncharacterized protein LOC127741164 n=1 Tax=Arachis duranensis TaxID=130453 RepID=A0A9C6WKD9_ARADU|nr:uncharacterized protein LOC127741164 [Arachis duranensis]